MKRNFHSTYSAHNNDNVGFTHDDNNQSNIDGPRSHKSCNHRAVNGRVLSQCLVITVVFALFEIIGGYFAHSVTLQADAIHMITDAVGLLIAYFANHISKKPATIYLTFGYGKAEAIGAMINCVFTFILTLGLLVETIYRFFAPVTVHGAMLFIVATVGFTANGIIVLLLSRHMTSLNIRAALLHALGDLCGSLAAIIAGAVIYYTNIDIIDPILSLVVISLILFTNYRLIRKSCVVLMGGVPENLDYEEIGKDLELIDGVVSVHDLHVWYMSSNLAALSAHLVISDLSAWQSILKNCQRMLDTKHDIQHVTIQYEIDSECAAQCCNAS